MSKQGRHVGPLRLRGSDDLRVILGDIRHAGVQTWLGLSQSGQWNNSLVPGPFNLSLRCGGQIAISCGYQ